VENQIQQVINKDKTLRDLFLLIMSVPGIGAVTATVVIISTKEMKDFNEPKHFACHAGVALFERYCRSGIVPAVAFVVELASISMPGKS
jgi:transposase